MDIQNKRSMHPKDAPTGINGATYQNNLDANIAQGRKIAKGIKNPASSTDGPGALMMVSPITLTAPNIAHSGDPAMTFGADVRKISEIVQYARRYSPEPYPVVLLKDGSEVRL